MNRRKSIVDGLERRLYAAYGAWPGASLGPLWRRSVMREVRLRGACVPAAAIPDPAIRFAWRFSAAAGIVALLLLVYIFTNGLVDYQDLAIRYLENPLDFLI